MEKRISFYEFQSLKSVAKACDPIVKKRDRVKAQIEELVKEYKNYDAQITALEAGVVKVLGFKISDLIKKVVEPDGKGGKITKFMPTDIVTYDDQKKQFVITTAEESTEEAAPAEEAASTEATQEETLEPTESNDLF